MEVSKNNSFELSRMPFFEEGKTGLAVNAFNKVKRTWVLACKMSLISAVPDDVAGSRSAEDISVDRLSMFLTECMIEDILKATGEDRCMSVTGSCDKAAGSAIEILKKAGVKNLLQFCRRDIREVEGLDPWTADRINEMKIRLSGDVSGKLPDDEAAKRPGDENAV